MFLVRINSRPDRAVDIYCGGDEHIGPRFFRDVDGFADLDGKPFQAYLCRACAERAAPGQVAMLDHMTTSGGK